MGKVIVFRPPDAAPRRAGEGGRAQILFFTGVRYQRDDPDAGAPEPISPAPAPRASHGGRRRRKG